MINTKSMSKNSKQMKQTDVLVIGGSAAGMVAAISGKNAWKNKNFTLVKKQKDVMVPCGIPYIFGTLDSSTENIMPVDMMLEKNGIESLIDEVTTINFKEKTALLNKHEAIKYDKLVIATGSTPTKPAWLKGADKENVFTIPKDKIYLDEMKNKLSSSKKIAIIGAGFIGVEFSDELNKAGYDVTLIEKREDILSLAFDKELSEKIEDIISQRGVKVKTGIGVAEITGNETVTGLLYDNKESEAFDAVILSMGYQPNNVLAQNAGITLDEMGFIPVDEYMRTDIEDVFAIGDCAQKRDFVTRKKTPTMLASTACAEARIAGMNLFNLQVVKTFSGTIAIYSTAIGSHGFGTAGITEIRANEEGLGVVTGLFEAPDRHPGKLPDTHTQMVKLIVAKNSGVIIGGEVIGGVSAGELTNVIGLAIENRMTVSALLTSQIGTHPCLTASPAAYPLIKAAEIIMGKLCANKC